MIMREIKIIMPDSEMYHIERCVKVADSIKAIENAIEKIYYMINDLNVNQLEIVKELDKHDKQILILQEALKNENIRRAGFQRY